MVGQANGFLGRTTRSRLVFGGVLLLLLVLTRWMWIDCDGGTPTLMEYGYFATDEGYYTNGGKQKLLYGRFINALRASPCTYAISPASHILAWFSFSIFGQTTWSHRALPFLINTVAWLVFFQFLSRRHPPWIVFLLCACCVLNPLATVYGRTACNDTLMASLLMVGYAIASRRGWASPVLGGFFFGFGLWIKQSIWLLFLIGLSGAATTSGARRKLQRSALFLAGFAVSAAIQYGLIRLLIHEDALTQNTSVDNLLGISNSSYPLPNLFDWASTFKGLSSFPRSPADGLLGLWAPLLLVFPALLLFRRLTESPVRWSGSLLLYAVLPAYIGAISLMPVFYTHYFIPLLAFVPVVWLEARKDMRRWAQRRESAGWPTLALALAGVLIAFQTYTLKPGDSALIERVLANAYNLPHDIVWSVNWPFMVGTAALLTLLGAWLNRRQLSVWRCCGILLSALVVGDLCFSQLVLSEAHKFLAYFSPTLKDVVRLFEVASVLLFFVVWGMPGFFRRGARWPLFFVALLVAGTLANPVWRRGSVELAHRAHLHKRAVAQLSTLLPSNAVVFGERAPQLCLPLKARVSAAPNADPVPLVLAMHERYPERPLFALIDAEHNYHYEHYVRNKERIQLQVLHTMKLPSFNTGLPSDVFLCRLHVTEPQRRGAR